MAQQHSISTRCPSANYTPAFPPDAPYCGLFYLRDHVRKYIPQVKMAAHTTVLSSAARTTLTQTFENTDAESTWKEVKYTFPLIDGVSVVAFTCTIGDRVVKGVVKEKQKAREVYEEARDKGDAAALLEQVPEAADVFITSVGNVPPKTTVRVEVTYLGELKHDAEVDGIRLTIPTVIFPRYGSLPESMRATTASLDTTGRGGLEITVDAQMSAGSTIKSIQSPSHPISVSIGTLSTDPDAEASPQNASASLSLSSAGLEKDFVLQVIATNISEPVAMLEQHPTLPNERALMATLVPKFALPPERPEIVFVCDRSGSMRSFDRIGNLKTALQNFLKSLPVGVKFNICSFGNRHSFLWEQSRTYDKASLDEATRHVDTFDADMGGTEMYHAVEDVFKRRVKGMNLEVLLLTDGDIWQAESFFQLIRKSREDSQNAIRLFTLGIGTGSSSTLVEGAARAGNGFSQGVGDNEKMNSKVVRMLKAALTPHIHDYTLEVTYEADSKTEDDEFELVDKVSDCLVIDDVAQKGSGAPEADTQKKTSLFDASVDVDTVMGNTGETETKFDHLPSITPPKLLQAPFEIPPLYPFNRTTVYMLMSNETIQRPVKSVILHATSQHGPLELEIPVTTLTEPGDMVHQLAARRGVKELEEGAGWIYHAKDSEQKPLKEKHEGRFSEMVEREAVRLGVKYQVGGRWCSFVAVESQKSGDSGKGRVIELDTVVPAMPPDSAGPRAFGAPPGLRMGSPLMAKSNARPMMAMAAAPMATGGPSYRARNAGTGPKVMFSAPTPLTRGSDRQHDLQTESVSTFGGPPPPPQSAASPGGHTSEDVQGSSTASRKKKSLFGDKPSRGGVDQFRGLRGGGSPEAEEEAPKPADPLEEIVSLQTFEGLWPSSTDVFRIVGASQEKIGEALRAKGGEWAERLASGGGDVLATAAVLAFLRVKMGDRSEEWEMIGDKAWEWLAGVVGGLDGKRGDVEGALGGLFG